MRLEYESAEKLKKDIIKIVGKYIPLDQYRLFFFGSRVKGTNSDRSDIDVGIEGEVPIPWSIMANIEEEIEDLPTLYKIEIVDFRRVPEKFKEVAFQHTELITQGP